LDHFVLPSGLTAELLPLADSLGSTLLARHFNPGHAIECMWFILNEAQRAGDSVMTERAQSVILASVEAGWDPVHGGLFRFIDRDGGRPRGELIGGRYETLVVDTWDVKLWWPHSEALYSTLLAYSLTRDARAMRAYQKVHEYTFKTFPNPDPRVREWIQIRNRSGDPVEQVVALPVKDPYHILRNMLLIVDLLATSEVPSSVPAAG
jgi:N-acylglucosamine 2-epimerase